MAKAIKKLDNKLSIRFIKSTKRFYITYGVEHIKIDNIYSIGFSTLERAESVATKLIPTHSYIEWVSNNVSE